ncbi:adhesion G-protein coupled receptor D1-like [Glandiceps talaboti]
MKTIAVASPWATKGCRRKPEISVNTKDDETKCLCNHLTSFAVLMQPVSVEIPVIHLKTLSIITYVGCSVSTACLLISFLVFLFLKLQSPRAYILKSTIISLLLAQLIFISGVHATGNKYVCMSIAIVLHFMFMTTFSWMLVQGINLYVKTKPGPPVFYRRAHFCAVGWGVPTVIVGVSAGIRWDHYGNENYCWLSLTNGMPAAFLAPAMTIVLINTIALIIVLRKFLGVKANAKKDDTDKIKAGLRASVVLLPLLGLTWLFGLFAVNEAAIVFQYFFTVFNSLQGVFIFIFHCLWNEEVRAAFRKRRGRSITSESDEMTRTTRQSHIQTTINSTTRITGLATSTAD